MRPVRGWLAAALLVLLTACGGGGGGSGNNAPGPVAGNAPPPPQPPPTPQPPPAPAPPPPSLFPVVSDADWDESAVRQVLHVFAFGGHAPDAQISAWADMDPRLAVREMLILDPRHDKLSPPDPLDSLAEKGGTLEGIRAFWAGDDPDNLIPPDFRELFDDSNPNIRIAAEITWAMAATKFGVNPVRLRMGLFETNYHLVVHQLLGNVADRSMIRYFDDIVNALASDANYEDVLTTAALSAAIATHYGHRENVYVNGEFFGNEDFGREYNQLFFGILGVDDPAYHEAVTVKNMARALSGIRVPYTSAGFAPVATYSPLLHDPNDLEILHTFVSGATAREKLLALSDVAINHPESLANLPVKIIGELADDRLTDADKAAIRDAWAAMGPEKKLMRFLQDYATSPLFLGPGRVKLLSTLERHFLVQNLMILNQLESYLNLYDFFSYAEAEGVQVFKPVSNVFGNQRGRDAAASSEIFRAVYNASTQNWYRFANPRMDLDDGGEWEKDWRQAFARPAGGYTVGAAARWLWQRFIADGLDHFGPLERAEVYALLAEGRNFAWVATAGADPERVYSADELSTDPALLALMDDLAARPLALDSGDPAARQFANGAMGQAVNFITATPYMFVRQGR